MGWAFGENDQGREIGYGVQATCDREGCEAAIDRGLGYVCGGGHDGVDMRTGEQAGCGGYFCLRHLGHYFRPVTKETHPEALRIENEEMSPQLCSACGAAWQERRELVLA